MCARDKLDVSVIITTYNQPVWLEKALYGYAAQTYRRFEVLIADDGSDAITSNVVKRFRQEANIPIRHVWHKDDGFRKCEILNKAILEAQGDYLVFTDGDCVPRVDFLETHVRYAEPGRLLSGGIVRLPFSLSQSLTREDIVTDRATNASWLRSQGLRASKKLLLLTQNARWAALLDTITTTHPTFNGANTSAWREDVLSVNGFDERMKYGGLDRELGLRLTNVGIRGKQIRHRAAAVHLYHDRPYANEESMRYNKSLRAQTVKSGATWTEFGAKKQLVRKRTSAKILPTTMQTPVADVLPFAA